MSRRLHPEIFMQHLHAWKQGMKLSSGILVPVIFALGVGAGFIRDVVLAKLFGASLTVDLFRMAFALPNLLSQTFGTVFVATMIPFIIRVQERSVTAKMQFYRQLLIFNLAVVLLLTVVGMTSVQLQVQFFYPGTSSQQAELLINDMLYCWLIFLFVGLSFAMRAIYNTKGIFLPGAATPLARAGLFVVILLVAVLLTSSEAITHTHLAVFSAVAGFSALLLHLLYFTGEVRKDIVASFMVRGKPWSGQHLELSRVLLIVLIYQVFMSGGRVLDRGYASYFPEGYLSAIEYSYGIIIAVSAVLATGFGTVFIPRIMRKVVQSSRTFRLETRAFAAVVMLSLVIGLLLFFFGEWVVALVFSGGAFDQKAVELTASVITWQGVSLGPVVATLILVQLMIALGRRVELVLAAIVKLAVKYASLEILLPVYGFESFGMTYTISEITMLMIVVFLCYLEYRRFRQQQVDAVS